MDRKTIYDRLDQERDYQEKRWNEATTQSRGIHSTYEWLVFIQDYLTEAMHIASRMPEPEAREQTLHIVRKITAIGINCLEQNGCPARIED